jgi:Sec-independent protein translocase protein TatA
MPMRDTELSGLAMTLSRDCGIKVTVSGEDSYCAADGSHINIARMPSTPTGRMLMTGLIFHEVGHRQFTNGSKPSGLLGDLTNIIEDIRIEACAIKDRPGTRHDLDTVTTYYALKGSLTPKDPASALCGYVMGHGRELILQQTGMRRILPGCKTMLKDAFSAQLVGGVEALLDKHLPALTSTRDARNLAHKIMELVRQCKDEAQQQEQSSGQSQRSNEQSQEQSQGQKGSSGDNNTDAQQSSIPESKGLTQKQIDSILTQSSTGYGDLSGMITREINKISHSISYDNLQDIPEVPQIGTVDPARQSRLNEIEALAACSKMRARLLTLMQGYKNEPVSHGSSGRKIDSKRLVRMGLGDARIFKRKTEQKALNTAVMILLDTSGSMAQNVDKRRTRQQIANSAAYALHYALQGMSGVSAASVSFAHRRSECPALLQVCDFNRKPDSRSFNLDSHGGTPIDKALWYARAALLQRPEPRKIVLLITDGHPSSASRCEAATWRCYKDGIEIAALGIDTNAVMQYWRNSRVISDVGTLPQAMFAAMENLKPGVAA